MMIVYEKSRFQISSRKKYQVHCKMRLLSYGIIFFFLSEVLSVKDYMFKDCDQSGFCKRNREYASNIRNSGELKSYYKVEGSSVKDGSFDNKLHINGNIVKEIPQSGSSVLFPFELSLLQGNNLRFKVDELRTVKSNRLNTRRYNETAQWILQAPENLPFMDLKKVKYKIDKDKVTVEYGDNSAYMAELMFDPFKLQIYYKGELQLVANDKNFFNYEHFRTKEDNEQQLLTEESTFNMFSDDFPDSKDDTMPLGPESIGLDFTFKDFKFLYGIPEHADSMRLKDTTQSKYPYRLYNVDIFEYETDSRFPMYGSIPLLTAQKPGVSIGLFWLNSADTYIDVDLTTSDVDSSTHWISENGILDIMIFIGKEPDDINKGYGLVTGYPQLPQLFSLGYHQCRWNYNDEKDVLEINDLMDKHQIPYDTIWLDIEYADSKQYFTWQHDKFPDPERMLKKLDHTGRNLVIIIDPHIKVGYEISDEIIKREIGIKNSFNETYHGHCWPGESVWIDTFNPQAIEYWREKHKMDKDNTFFGRYSTNIHLWNDMNEPSAFNGPETSVQKDTLHYGDWEHRSIHNTYGLTLVEATYESLLERLKDTPRQRPFILTRSYTAGSQRTSAMWTGDNMSKWEYLRISVPMVLTSNIVTMPFAGADVGGFFGNPSVELLVRWYQTGIWYPFFRAHAHIDSRRREPWVPGDPYTSYIRDAIMIRYSLLPVFYTSFHESSVSGTPVIKPLFYFNSDNQQTYSIDDQFFLGNSGIMVKPVTTEGAVSASVYIPDDEIYYDFMNGQLNGDKYILPHPKTISRKAELSDIPMFIKGGSIFARKERYRRSSRLMKNDPYTIVVALDKTGHATGKLYLDDGESFDYLSGRYVEFDFEASVDKFSSQSFSKDPEFLNSLGKISVEKIEIVGIDSVLKVSIMSDNDKKNLPFALKDGVLIITNPKVDLRYNWSVNFEHETPIVHDEL